MIVRLLCLLALLGTAQQAEIATHDVPVTFKSRVSLVSVPVVVRDQRGRAVGNLVRDDFQLFDDGKPQILSRFSVEHSGGSSAVTAAVPDRFVVYFFDDLHLKPEHLIWTREAALRHLSESVNASERIALYTASGQNSLEFTADRDRLRQALTAISARGARGDASGQCPPMTEFLADRIVNRNDIEALRVGIADYIACAGPQPGGADKIVQNAARRALALGDTDAHMVLDAITAAVAKLATMPGQRSIVMLSPGFLLIDSSRRAQLSDLIDRAIRVNVMAHALDARALAVHIPGGDASERDGNVQTSRQRANYRRLSDLQESGVMADLATGTGGHFFENTNDAAGALARTAAPEYLYILGFVPDSLKFDGKYRALKVTLRNPKGLKVEARAGYHAPKGSEDPAEKEKQRVEEMFFSSEDVRELPADLQVQFFKSGTDATVSVLAKLNLGQIAFRKEGDRNRDDIILVAGLFDENGNYISGVQKTLEMHLRDETLERYRTPGYTVRTDFSVPSGKYMVRLVVRDSEGKQLTARSASVEVP